MVPLKITKKQVGKVFIAKRDYIVYKQLSGAIAQLVIPKGSTIVVPERYSQSAYSSAHSEKLRCDNAIVLSIIPRNRRYYTYTSIWTYETVDPDKCFESLHSPSFKYKMGKTVTPIRRINLDPRKTCVSGIHFFTDLNTAERY